MTVLSRRVSSSTIRRSHCRKAGSPSWAKMSLIGFAGARFDDVVGIQESEMHALRRQPAHARLPGAHEPDEGKIMD